MIGDTVVGVVECADSSRFRVEVNVSLGHNYHYVVWVMHEVQGGLAYAYHRHADGTAIVTSARDATVCHEQLEMADFLRDVGRRHTFISWQPSVL